MKKIILFTLTLIPFFLFSQIQWQENGMPVYCGENVNWTGTTINSDDGNMVMIWSDSRNGDRGIFAQKVTSDGTFLWGENGLEINDDPDTQHQAKATTSINNEIIIAWISHYGNFDMEIRVQKIDAFGNRLWQDEGVLLFTGNEIFPYRIQIIDDSVGGAFVVWRNYTLEPIPITVKGLHVLADGSIDSNWNAGGNILIQHLQPYNFDILPDGFGGFIYAWRSLDNLKIQRIGSNGNPLWGDEGIVLCEETVCNDHIGVVSDNNGLFYFFWKDSRNTNPNMVYMQKVDINGTTLFPDDLNIYSTDNSLNRIDAIYTSDDNLAICWTEYDNPQSMIKTMKLDTSGNSLFDPINIYNGVYSGSNIGIISDDNGGYWMKWYCFANSEELYVQHIDESGAITLNNNGLLICESMQDLCLFTINLTSDNRAFLSWSDESTGNNSIYVQVVDEVGNLQFPDDALNIYGGPSGYTYDLEVFPNEDNPIFIWINDSGRSRIFAQSLNSDGSPVFDENGIPITPLFSNSQENFAANIPSGSNEIAIVWEMNEEGYKQIYSQAVDLDGNFLWSDSTGLIVGQSSAHQEIPKISSINSSGTYEYYIGWHDFTDYMDSQIKGQKIINGNLQWGEDGKVIVDREGNDELTDILENYYIWQSAGNDNENIFCLMVDENGDPAPGWSENGLEVCVEDGRQWQPRGIIIPQGLLIFWKDSRNGNNYEIYGQIITYDGNILWQEGGIPLIEGEDIYNFNVHYNDALYIVWNEYIGENHFNYYIQKFNENGETLWQEGGVRLSYWNQFMHSDPVIASVEQDILIVWEHRFINESTHLIAQLVSPNGELQYGLSGITICDQIMVQDYPQVYVNGTDAYICWRDGRSTIMGEEGLVSIYAIYAQKLHLEPTIADDELVEPIEILSNYPNPFNPETTISFSVTQTFSFVKIDIFNIKGQKVKTLPINQLTNLPVNQVVWNGKNNDNQPVASGIYFYQLNVNDKVIASKKCLLLK